MTDNWTPSPAKLANLWDRVRNSLWFVPVLCTAGGVLAAIFFLAIDYRLDGSWKRPFWLETTIEGAQTVLSTISGGMITVVGVVLSMTMVTLSITSSQFGSRVLRSRLSDRTTQWTIGAFLGTTVYSLLVLKMVRRLGEDEYYVPHLSVMASIVFALASLVFLLYFIHHVTMIAQAPQIVAKLSHDLHHAIERVFPEKIGEPLSLAAPAGDEIPDDVRQALINGVRVCSQYEGYIQAVEAEMLMDWARKHDAVLKLPKRPGDFVAREECLTIATPVSADEQDELAQVVNQAFIIGNSRTPRQDVNCAVHELSQMAVRALSPGINDPYTAVNCIDRLSAALAHLARRKMPEANRLDPEGHLRLVVDRQTFSSVLAAAFDQIRYEAVRSVAVSERLMEALDRVATNVTRPEQAEAVLRQARLNVEGTLEAGHHPGDTQGVQNRLALLANKLQPILDQRSPETPNEKPPVDESDEEAETSGEVIG